MVDRSDDAPQSGSTAAWFTIATLPFLVLVAFHWPLGPLSALGDWAQYLLHAEALYRGRSYTETGYIFTALNPFIGPQAQPPGLPAILVPIVAATDAARDQTPYKLLMVAFALAFMALAFTYFRRRTSAAIAAATTMVTGLWLEVSFVSNVVQPDVAFSAFVWAILCLADRPSTWTPRRVVAITLLGLLALTFRAAAVPLVPALAAYAIAHRRATGWRPLAPVAVWLICGLIAALAVPEMLSLARAIRPSRVVHNIAEAAATYPYAVVELLLYPFPRNAANDVYHAALAGVAVVGAIGWFRRESTSLLMMFAVLYIGMLLVLPFQDGRYLMPLAPLAVFATWSGLATVTRWVAMRFGGVEQRRVDHVVAGIAFVACALTVATQMRQPRPKALLDVPGVASIFSLLRNEHGRSPVRAMFVNPRVLTWETGIPAMGFFRASPDSTLAELRAKGITHVVVGDVNIDPYHFPFIAQAITERPEAFRSVFAEGVFTVYRFDSTRVQRP